MRRRRRNAAALVFAGLLAGGCAPEAPTFESELWPGEGRPRFAAAASELELRSEPSAASPVARTLAVAAGAPVSWDRTRYRTVEPGRVVATATSELFVRRLGDARYLSRDDYYEESEWQAMTFREGESLEYLQERAEGGCLLRRAAEVLEAEECPWLWGGPGPFELTTAPVVEWWVRVTDGEGAPQGWLRVDGPEVRPLEREL